MSVNKKENFSKSIGYLFVSQGLIKILGLLYSLYLINKPKFGDEGNAIYLSGYQIFAFMLTFSSIGVPNSVSNIVAKCDNYSSLNKVFRSAIYIYVSFACISSVFLYLTSSVIAEKFIGIEMVSYNLKILAPIIIVNTLESIYIGFFNGIKQMKITAKIQFFEQLFKCFFTIGIVEILSKKTVDSNILSLGATLGVATSIIFSFILCFFEKQKTNVYAKSFKEENLRYKTIIKNLLRFSIPISIGAMLVGINKNIDSFSVMNILAKKIGKDSAKKIYGIIASKVDVLVLFPLAFNITFSTALIPNISEARKNKDDKAVEVLVENAVFMSIIIGIASTMGLYFFSEEIFYLLFSNAQDGQYLLKLSAFSIIFAVLNQTFSGILQGLQENKIPVIASFIGMITKVAFNLSFVNCNSLLENGIILSTIISNITMFLILYNKVKKNIKFHFKRYFIIIFIASIFMVGCIGLFNKIFILLKISRKISFIISAFLGIILFFLEIIGTCRIFNIVLFQKSNSKMQKI